LSQISTRTEIGKLWLTRETIARERARERPIKELLVVRQEEEILSVQSIDDCTIRRAAQTKQDDVINLMSLFPQSLQQCEREILIE